MMAWRSSAPSMLPKAGILPGLPVAIRFMMKSVALVDPHELRALAGLAPALLVAPAADVGEESGHLLVAVQPDIRAGLRHGEGQRDDARPRCPPDGSRPAHPSNLLLRRRGGDSSPRPPPGRAAARAACR